MGDEMDTDAAPQENAGKCANCRYAISVAGKCSYHDLPLAEAVPLSCEGRAGDFADGSSRPRKKPFTRKRVTFMESLLFGFLTVCGAMLFLMAFVLFFASDDEAWRGIWGVIGFVFLGGLGFLCFLGSGKHLKDVYLERKKIEREKKEQESAD